MKCTNVMGSRLLIVLLTYVSALQSESTEGYRPGVNPKLCTVDKKLFSCSVHTSGLIYSSSRSTVWVGCMWICYFLHKQTLPLSNSNSNHSVLLQEQWGTKGV